MAGALESVTHRNKVAKECDFAQDAVASMSFLTRFDAISKGVIDLRDLLFFASLIVAWLAATAVVVDLKKAD